MRVLAFVAAVVAAAFGLVGAMSLWSSAGALERADHNTAQVVRIQGIYADLVRADADATSSFLVGGIEDPAQRADYDASLDRVATGIADAADAQPADSEALGALNAAVQDYAATIEEARVYNRQGQPVGAQYLSGASATLRSDILPIVKTLVGRQQGPGRCRVRRQQPASDADPRRAWAPWRCSCSSWSGWPGAPTATSTRRCSSGPWWSLLALGYRAGDAGVGRQPGPGGPELLVRLHGQARRRSDGGVRREVEREPDPHRPRVRAGLREGLADAVGQPPVLLGGPRQHTPRAD